MGTLRAVIKILLFFGLSLIVVPPQFILINLYRGRGAYYIPQIFHKGVCLIFNIKVLIEGVPNTKSQTLFVSNHLSYLDIPVIGSVLHASFVAKEDVAKWPIFGFLSKLQQTTFISRNPEHAHIGRQTLERTLKEGKNIILFPEGTSTNGLSVRPFKSSLFAIAFQNNIPHLTVQPLTIKIIMSDTLPPTNPILRDLYAWHIEMDTPLPQHLWEFAKRRGSVISLTFHAPIQINQDLDRKTLAIACQNAVSNGLDKIII